MKPSVGPEVSGFIREPTAVSTGRGVSYLGLQNLISSLGRIVAFAFFARLITVQQMGVFTILSLAIGVASTITGLGLNNIVTKFVAENVARGDKVQAASVYYKSVVLSEVASVVFAMGIVLSKFPASIAGLPNSFGTEVIGLFLALDVAVGIAPTAASAFYGLFEFRNYAFVYGVYSTVRPWLVVLLIYEVRSMVGLVGAWVISDAFLGAYMFLHLWRRLGPPVFRFETKRLLRLATPLYLANLASLVYGSFDQFTLIPLVSLAALGVYGATLTAFSAYTAFVALVGTVLLPVFSGLHGSGGRVALENSIQRASRYLSIVFMPIALLLVSTARPTLTLLVGVSYSAGALPLAVLSLASTTTIVSLAFGSVLIVLNETLLAALTAIIPVPLGIGVALISIPLLGILGAAIARAVSMLLSLFLTWYFVRRKISIKLDMGALTKSLAASAVMALAVGAMQLLHYSRFFLPAYVVVGVFVYLLAMRGLRAINIADVELIRQMLGPRLGRICNLLARFAV